jgi:hypothetical protein
VELREQREAQFNDFAHRAQVEQSGPMGFLAHDPGPVGSQIKQRAPGIREHRHALVAGDTPQEKGHGNGRCCRLDALTGLVHVTGEVPGLGPRGGGIACDPVPARF